MSLIANAKRPASAGVTVVSFRSLLQSAVEVAVFVSLLAAAAQVRVPMPGTPVPMTLQLLAVLAVGLSLPWRSALAVVGAYLGLSAAGLPVLAPGSTGVLGPTGGYLLGFVPAVVVCGGLAGPTASIGRRLMAAILAAACVLAVGAVGLTVWSGGAWQTAIRLGVWPFAVKAIVEAIAAALLCEVLPWRRWRLHGHGGISAHGLN